jgi:hypothetical protein
LVPHVVTGPDVPIEAVFPGEPELTGAALQGRHCADMGREAAGRMGIDRAWTEGYGAQQ